MSNQLVGQVYNRIVEDVIEASQIDFEESGVDQQTLDELREVWQRKLSSLNVAAFPWEPPPAPPPIVNPPTVPSNVSRPPPAPQQSASPTTSVVPASNGGQSGPTIKTEPGYDPGMSGLPATSGISNQAAQQRAASLMQQQFGNQASRQIGALQAGIALPGQQIPGQQRPQGLQLPGQAQAQPPQYAPQQVHQAQQPPVQHQQQNRNGVGNAQTDGPSDASQPWEIEAMQGLNESTETNEIDHVIRRRVEQMGLEMEAGGLMLPLSEKKKTSSKLQARKRKANNSTKASSSDPSSSSTAAAAAAPGIPRYDGGDDSDEEKDDFDAEEDEDAINSDLDDPEENLDAEDDDDDAIGQNMLCTYDKVQRTKNKWKCTLKDGVLTTGGKEYVFHKAQGEFEW